METVIMKGKPVADAIGENIVTQLKEVGFNLTPWLCAILPEGDEEARSYTDGIAKKAEKWNCAVSRIVMPADSRMEDYVSAIEKANNDPTVHGILLLRPLPKHLNTDAITAHIAPDKDVDGVTPTVMADLYLEHDGFAPATAAAILALLDANQIELKGMRAAVVGRSRTVGKPAAMLLLGRHATVTICHSRTKDLGSVLRENDIVVCAVGVAGLVTKDMIKPGAIVIDAGFNVLADGSIMGDINPEVVAKASYYAPVPGGVGPLTVACLLNNLTKAALRSLK